MLEGRNVYITEECSLRAGQNIKEKVPKQRVNNLRTNDNSMGISLELWVHKVLRTPSLCAQSPAVWEMGSVVTSVPISQMPERRLRIARSQCPGQSLKGIG